MAADFAAQAICPNQSRAVRIDNTARSTSVSSRSGVSRSAGGGGFFVADDAATARAAGAQPMAATAGIEALLALQAVEDPLFAKRKAVKRGNALLDALESIKADLLLGQVSEGRLNQLMALIGQARERNLPELDGLLDDIELRARVELAKFGRFPGF
jgi:Class II flagellar assembly regulator